jgi:hypothetical protein
VTPHDADNTIATPEQKSRHPGAHLAGPLLDDEVRALADGSGLLREGLGRSGVSLGLEVMLIVRHGDKRAGERDRTKRPQEHLSGDESERARACLLAAARSQTERRARARERNGGGSSLLHKTPRARHHGQSSSCGVGLSGDPLPVRSRPRRPRYDPRLGHGLYVPCRCRDRARGVVDYREGLEGRDRLGMRVCKWIAHSGGASVGCFSKSVLFPYSGYDRVRISLSYFLCQSYFWCFHFGFKGIL